MCFVHQYIFHNAHWVTVRTVLSSSIKPGPTHCNSFNIQNRDVGCDSLMSCIGLGSQILHSLWLELGQFTSLMLADQQLLINPSQLELKEYNIVHKKARQFDVLNLNGNHHLEEQHFCNPKKAQVVTLLTNERARFRQITVDRPSSMSTLKPKNKKLY